MFITIQYIAFHILLLINNFVFFSGRYFCWRNQKPFCVIRGKMCDGSQECDDGSDETQEVCESMPKCGRYRTKGQNGMEKPLYLYRPTYLNSNK